MATSINKRSELSNLLRKLADYVDSRSDAELIPLFEQALRLKPEPKPPKKSPPSPKQSLDAGYFRNIVLRLRTLPSREAGEDLLRESNLRKEGLESLARTLQLPIQRDDSIERLRSKIVENVIGSRLRSEAIQGGGRAPSESGHSDGTNPQSDKGTPR